MINLGVRFNHPSAIATRVRYARVDNTNVPAWVTVFPNPTTSPAILAQNIDNGQYQIEMTPIYADGRICTPTIVYTSGCAGLISINAYIQSGNLIVEYLAPSDVPKVRITVDYPNGGSFDANYVNNGNDISIPLPTNVNGDFFVYGQSICDESTGFYSTRSNAVTVTKNSNPSLTQTSQSQVGPGSTRSQTFTVGANVSANNKFVLTVYSHDVIVVANPGDTSSSIANKLRDAINATSEATWNEFGSAPITGTVGFKPTATASGSSVILVLNYTNSFASNAYIL